MSAAKSRKRDLRESLKKVYDENFAPAGLDHPPTDLRYQVKQYAGAVRDEHGRRYMVLHTGNSKWYLFYRLLDETSICIGEGIPVEKSSLPKDMRRALAIGFCNGTARPPRRAVISYGPDEGPLDTDWVLCAIQEAQGLHPKPAYLIFAAQQLTDEAIKLIETIKNSCGIEVLSYTSERVTE
jgi:hypothetical protein